MPEALVDNDIVLKACCYSIHLPMVATIVDAAGTPAMLSLARYVVSGRIKRDKQLNERQIALDNFDWVLATVETIDPDGDEIRLAAAFESAAQAQNLELDGGESQLLAILLCRSLKLMVTGDKRAIRAIEIITAETPPSGTIACFEQLVVSILQDLGIANLRALVCSQPHVDRALSICFGCQSNLVDTETIGQGLESYISDLRRDAPQVMVVSNDLSGLIA